MTDQPEQQLIVDLSLPLEEHWKLHHVLLDRLERERAEEELTESGSSGAILQAFETLDTGDTSFTGEQLDVMRTILAEYHHSSHWSVAERSRLERLLHRITIALEE